MAVNTVGFVLEAAHVNNPPATAQLPLLDTNVKVLGPREAAVPVKVAHVPVVYHVPALIIQPFAAPPTGLTGIVPLPMKGTGVVVDVLEVVVEVTIFVDDVLVELGAGFGFTPLGSHWNVAGQEY